MTRTATTLIAASGLKAGFLANLPPGTLVVETLSEAAAGTAPGLGLIVQVGAEQGFDEPEQLLAFTAWSSVGIKPGELIVPSGMTGLQIHDCALSAEIDLKASAPSALRRPAGPRPPALTVKDGNPLILAVNRPLQPAHRQWIAFDLKGRWSQSYTSGGTALAFGFDEWVLVLSLGENRTEIRIKPEAEAAS